MFSKIFLEDKKSSISKDFPNNYQIELDEDKTKEDNLASEFELKSSSFINSVKEEKKNVLNLNEIIHFENKNLDTFSFIDESEKNDNSIIFEFENFEKEKIPNPDKSKHSNPTYFTKIPYDKIKSIIKQDNIIYKKKNNISPDNYNKRIRYLGKKTNRAEKCKFNFSLNFKEKKYNPFMSVVDSKNKNISHINKVRKIYNSPIPVRNDTKKSKSLFNPKRDIFINKLNQQMKK